MNYTRQGAFIKVESAFAFIKDQAEAHYRTKQAHYQAIWIRIKRSMAMSLVTTLVILTNWTHLTTQAQEDVSALETAVRLDKESYTLLVIEEPTLEIKPGKSLAQLQAEAARARHMARRLGSTQVAGPVVSASTDEAHRLAQEAAHKAGIPEYWKELAAIWQVESGKKVYTCVISRADGRAVGPMQFMPGTFRSYQVDGDGDGQADICNAKDALVAAGHLLKSGGIADGKVDQAIHRYNHSMAYVRKVKRIADSIN